MPRKPRSCDVVSVVIPFVNDAHHLPRTLHHLSQLNYPSLEFIFVNDGSTDGSVRLVEDWLTGLGNKGWCGRLAGASDKKTGVAAAREHGVALARGEWVWFCDSDDTFTATIVTDMVAAGADLVVCRAVHIEPGGRRRSLEGYDTPTRLGQAELTAAIAGGRVRGYLWNKLIRRTVLEAAIAQRPQRLSSQSDFMLIAAVAQQVKQVMCIPEVGYFYRERAGSVSTGEDLKITNTVACADHFVAISGLSARASEYFRTWFYRVPCYATPTHQGWERARKARVQAAVRAEMTWTGLLLVARGVPELGLPAMRTVALHGAAQKILGAVGVYDLCYALMRSGVEVFTELNRKFSKKDNNDG